MQILRDQVFKYFKYDEWNLFKTPNRFKQRAAFTGTLVDICAIQNPTLHEGDREYRTNHPGD